MKVISSVVLLMISYLINESIQAVSVHIGRASGNIIIIISITIE